MYFKKINGAKKDCNPASIKFNSGWLKCLSYCPDEWHIELKADYLDIWS